MNARRVYSSKTDRTSGVVFDQTITMNGFYIAKDYPEHLRSIRFKDPESGKTLVFLNLVKLIDTRLRYEKCLQVWGNARATTSEDVREPSTRKLSLYFFICSIDRTNVCVQ